MYWGLDPDDPGLMSRTIWVPAAVPLVTHSSRPSLPSSAVNSAVPLPSGVVYWGLDPDDPGLMSRTIWVPARVPSVTHSSRPCVLSRALNSAVPLPSEVMEEGEMMLSTRLVPSVAPSVIHR